MGRAKRIWYLSPMRAAKVQASLRIRAVSPEPSLLAHTSSESRGTFRQKPRSMAPLNGWACAVKICHDGMLEDTNSLDAAHIQRHKGNKCPFRTRQRNKLQHLHECSVNKRLASFLYVYQSLTVLPNKRAHQNCKGSLVAKFGNSITNHLTRSFTCTYSHASKLPIFQLIEL